MDIIVLKIQGHCENRTWIIIYIFIKYVVLVGFNITDWPLAASIDLWTGHISGFNEYIHDVYQMKAFDLKRYMVVNRKPYWPLLTSNDLKITHFGDWWQMHILVLYIRTLCEQYIDYYISLYKTYCSCLVKDLWLTSSSLEWPLKWSYYRFEHDIYQMKALDLNRWMVVPKRIIGFQMKGQNKKKHYYYYIHFHKICTSCLVKDP